MKSMKSPRSSSMNSMDMKKKKKSSSSSSMTASSPTATATATDEYTSSSYSSLIWGSPSNSTLNSPIKTHASSSSNSSNKKTTTSSSSSSSLPSSSLTAAAISAVEKQSSSLSPSSRYGGNAFIAFVTQSAEVAKLRANADMLPPMSWEEKCEIIDELCIALKNKLDRLISDKEGSLEVLRTALETAINNMRGCSRDRNELTRNVLSFAELLNPSGKPYCEDIERYMKGRLSQKRRVKKKLEDKNRRLQKMVTTVSEQYESKADVKDRLHDSDVMELQIFNQELDKQLSTRSDTLDDTRICSRKMAKDLEEMSKELGVETRKNGHYKQCLSDRSPLVGKFAEEINEERNEKERLTRDYLDLARGERSGPTAMDYMLLRQRAKDRRKDLYNWLAKVEIAEFTYSELSKYAAALAKSR